MNRVNDYIDHIFIFSAGSSNQKSSTEVALKDGLQAYSESHFSSYPTSNHSAEQSSTLDESNDGNNYSKIDDLYH